LHQWQDEKKNRETPVLGDEGIRRIYLQEKVFYLLCGRAITFLFACSVGGVCLYMPLGQR